MNRILLALLALGAAATGIYLLTQDSPAPAPKSADQASVPGPSAPAPSEPARREKLVDPNAVEADREAAAAKPKPGVPNPDGASKGGLGTDPAIKKEEERSLPVALPSDDEALAAVFTEKYSGATGDERRLALESLTLLYKDAAAGRIKDGEKMLLGIQSELDWLGRNLDP